MELFKELISKNGLLFAFLLVGLILGASQLLSKHLFKGRIPAAAIAIIGALFLALFGADKGLANIEIFAGLAVLGGSMFRDFTVVATAMGAEIEKIKQAGLAGILSLFIGVSFSFVIGVIIAYAMGYTDVKDLTAIGAGACTYIVGPITGTAIGASSDVIALGITAGVVKTIVTTILTPLVAKQIKLTTPHAAMVFGGLIGTTSGVTAGLAATDKELVPYGAFTATFYTGLGCLLCPSIFYYLLMQLLG